MNRVERKLVVCSKMRCNNCPFVDDYVPDDCEYAMKHILNREAEGVVVDLPRRSGKTSKILRLAMELEELGNKVMILVPTAQYGYELQRQMMGSGVEIASVGGWNVKDRSVVTKLLHGRPPMAVLSDEVKPWIVKFVKNTKKHRFVLGTYSSVG